MACFESATVIDMAPREAITLHDVRGATLRVTRGTVWLTQENDRHDIVLRAGDNWVVERSGATVLEAQDDTALCVIGRALDVETLQAQARQSQASESRGIDWRARLAALVGRRPYAPYY
jgi:hypothetical protein